MIHYSFEDLLIFSEEFRRFGLSSVDSLVKNGSSFYLKSNKGTYCVKFVATFPGYRLVHVPVSVATGSPVLTDLFPAVVKSFKIFNLDRVFGLWLKNKGKEFAIIFELIGSLNNMFVLNEDGKIIYSARRVSDKRSLKPGVIYSLPERKVFRSFSLEYDYSVVTCGYICENNGNKVLLKEPLSESCIKYEPYTYALDIFFESFLVKEQSRGINSALWEIYIDILSRELDPDYVFESDSYISHSGMTIPVKKGSRCSKVIGYYRSLIIKGLKKDEIRGAARDRASPYLEFISPSGMRVLVGKSAKANSVLTFNLAKAHDILFHVRDYPGAHVILFTEGNPPTKDDILFCAKKALLFSKAGAGKWEVIYAPITNVYRRRGLSAGEVLFKTYKSVVVEK